MTHEGIRAAVRAAERVVGRPRLAKVARVINNEVRLDSANTIEANGEQMVQRLALTAEVPVVFDVGAHFGEWSESLLEQPGTRPTVHAFEPSSYSRQRAEERLGDRAYIHPFALSDGAGSGVLHIVKEGAGTNSLVTSNAVRPATLTETVEVRTVDSVALMIGLDRITLLKVDVEGNDLATIRGAAKMLHEQAIDLIQFEYNHRWIASRSYLFDAFELLQPHGYQLGKITPRGVEVYPAWHHELEKFVEGNYLAWLPAWSNQLTTVPWWGG